MNIAPGSKRCIGWKETEGKCENQAGTRWTPYWCEECDSRRRAHVMKQFEKFVERRDGCTPLVS